MSRLTTLRRVWVARLEVGEARQPAESVVRTLEAELCPLLHRGEGLRLQLQAASEVNEHVARARGAACAQGSRR